MAGAFQRLADTRRRAIEISIDGDNVQVLEGDTLLTAILLHHDHLRLSDIGEEPRAGFCLMGACQDCWVSESNGRRLRACTTYVRPGLAIVTGRPNQPVVETTTSHAAASEPVETPAESDALPADGDAP
jgi:predicted molibdopterin-dependent oxidoreductase YjgC